MLSLYLLMLMGVATGYYASTTILIRTKYADNSVIPLVAAVVGGMAGYWIALTVAPPFPTGDIVWAEQVHQVYDQAELDAALTEAPAGSPTLVGFYADWCGPCHAEAPGLNELALVGERIVVVDVDRSPTLADRYDVSGLPSTLIFKNGQEIHRSTGYHSKRALQKLLTSSTGS